MFLHHNTPSVSVLTVSAEPSFHKHPMPGKQPFQRNYFPSHQPPSCIFYCLLFVCFSPSVPASRCRALGAATVPESKLFLGGDETREHPARVQGGNLQLWRSPRGFWERRENGGFQLHSCLCVFQCTWTSSFAFRSAECTLCRKSALLTGKVHLLRIWES